MTISLEPEHDAAVIALWAKYQRRPHTCTLDSPRGACLLGVLLIDEGVDVAKLEPDPDARTAIARLLNLTVEQVEDIEHGFDTSDLTEDLVSIRRPLSAYGLWARRIGSTVLGKRP